MKKIILIIIMIIVGFTYSCNKTNPSPKVCNCGLVESDDVTDYSVIIKNSCSGNNKKFWLQQGDWMNAYVGSNYCITNVTSW